MITIKSIIRALLIASVVCVVVLYKNLNFGTFQNEYGQITDGNMRRILSQQELQQHNPNHLAQVKIDSDKPKNTSKSQYRSVKDNQIVLAICCPEPENIALIQTLSNDFILLFQNAALRPLQKATANTPLYVSHTYHPQTKRGTITTHNTSTYAMGSTLHTIDTTTTHTTYTTVHSQRLNTKLSTNDIQISYQHHTLSNIATSPLLMIYTLNGEETFIHNLIKQLYLRSNRLEIGITTSIESRIHSPTKGSLFVRWVSPRFEIPSIALDSSHINMVMQQINAAKNIQSGIHKQLKKEQLSFHIEKKRHHMLQKERASLDSMLQFALMDTYPQLQDSHKTIQASVNHLRLETVLIQHQIEALKHEQTALEAMIDNSKHDMDMYQGTWYLNEQTVAKLKHELKELHKRRLKIIKELQDIVTRFEATVQVVMLYQVYLKEKKKYRVWKDTHNSEKKFIKKNESMLECTNYAAHAMCGERVILCRGTKDIFEYDTASIVADIHFKHPAIFKHNYEILVLTNSECNSEVLEEDKEIKASTVHKCSFEDKNCILQSQSAYSTFGKTQALKDICIYIRCNVTDAFDIDAVIAVNVGQKDVKQKASTLKLNKNSVTFQQTITKEKSNDDKSKDDKASDESEDDEQDSYDTSSSEHLKSMIAVAVAVVCTLGALLMSIFFVPRL